MRSTNLSFQYALIEHCRKRFESLGLEFQTNGESFSVRQANIFAIFQTPYEMEAFLEGVFAASKIDPELIKTL